MFNLMNKNNLNVQYNNLNEIEKENPNVSKDMNNQGIITFY